jgi:opacity protein-like surface antigen
MQRNETPPCRLARVAIWRFASTALLGVFLLLPATALGADDRDEIPRTKLDFHFQAPRASLGLRGGWAFNRSEGEIYDFLTELLTLERDDFDAPAIAADFSWRLTSWMDVVFGFEWSGTESSSEFRDWVDQNGNPIEQDTRLDQVPLTVSLKVYPIGRGRQVGDYAWVRKPVVPYVGGGIGGTYYKLQQTGDFVDFVDLTIFEGDFSSEGFTFAQHVFAGIDFKLTRSLGLILEGRYYWASADLEGDYIGFDPIDLDGARVMVGINWKL